MLQVRLQFPFERKNCGAVPYLEKYLIPQFSRRIEKISVIKF